MNASAVPPLPPAIEILLAEKLPADSRRLKRRFSKSALIRDLHDQALASLGTYQYYTAGGDDFAVAPAPSLDPLSRIRPCPHPECLAASVANLGRTLALYADVVVLPDTVTPIVAATPDNSLGDAEAHHLLTVAFSLQLLRPLIDAGVVRFVFGEQVMCRRHLTMFDRSVTRVSKTVAKNIIPDVEIVKTEFGFSVTNEAIFAPVRGYGFQLPNVARLGAGDLRKHATTRLAEQLDRIVRETALEMYSAEDAGVTYVLDSILVAQALAADHRGSILPEISNVNLLPTLRLPWVADLNLSETLELRDTARSALTRLRVHLRKALQTGSSAASLIADLREQAADVEAELAAQPIARNRQFRYAAAGLGLTLSLIAAIVGPAPASALGAGGTLLSLLSLLHGSESKDQHDIARLQGKPGYVLLRAKELIDRRSHS